MRRLLYLATGLFAALVLAVLALARGWLGNPEPPGEVTRVPRPAEWVFGLESVPAWDLIPALTPI